MTATEGNSKMSTFQIKHRYTSAVMFECELTVEVSTQSVSLQLGFAIKAAVRAGADLAGANLARAYLAGANLKGANLVDGGQRSDGYRFVGSICDGVLWIDAGCHFFPIAEGREHWTRTRSGTPLGAETTAILDHIEAVAKIRGMVP
jgi:uncharacterized protein YjbI with pentapeptide repeats